MVMVERVHTHSCFYYVRGQSAQCVIAADENQCGFQPDPGCVVVILTFKKVVTIYKATSEG